MVDTVTSHDLLKVERDGLMARHLICNSCLFLIFVHIGVGGYSSTSTNARACVRACVRVCVSSYLLFVIIAILTFTDLQWRI